MNTPSPMHTRPYLMMNRLILDDAASAADTAYKTAPPLFAKWVSCGALVGAFIRAFISALVSAPWSLRHLNRWNANNVTGVAKKRLVMPKPDHAR
ncbi:MAG: hypothetical protein ACRC6P_15850 [Shewanella oncorhynchi]